MYFNKSGTYAYFYCQPPFEKELAEEGFFRVHRSYLINLRCVDSFCKTDIKMSNGDMAMLSARKSAEFKKHLMEYRYYIANG